MKLLVVSPRPPWPPTMADSMTVDRMLRFLADRGHEVDLACFVESEAASRQLHEALGGVCHSINPVLLPKWQSYLRTALTLLGRLPMQVQYFREREMERTIARLVADRDYDLVYAHAIRVVQYTRHLALPKVVGLQTSCALNLSRMARHSGDPMRKLFYAIESAKIRPYEAEICADFDRVLLCGRADIDTIEESVSVPHALVCPHGQDIPPLERVRRAKREPGAIIITGVMSTYTNVDAATWFVEEVFPRIEKEHPEASFWIVGRNPQRALRALARPPKVVVTGEVPDIYDWLCKAQIAVAPLRIGAGMQNKIVQAMACELPVVATRVANEGICAEPEENILVRDDPQAMAEAICHLLRHPQARQRLGSAGRRFVEENWTWEAHFEEFERILLEVRRARSRSRESSEAASCS